MKIMYELIEVSLRYLRNIRLERIKDIVMLAKFLFHFCHYFDDGDDDANDDVGDDEGLQLKLNFKIVVNKIIEF